MYVTMPRPTIYRRHCTLVLQSFSSYVSYTFFQDAQKLPFSSFFFFFLARGSRGNTCNLRVSSCYSSFLEKVILTKMSLVCVLIVFYPRCTKCINTFFPFEALHYELNFCFEPYLLYLIYFCLGRKLTLVAGSGV